MESLIKQKTAEIKFRTARIELYLALEKFCDSVGQHDPCLNFGHCDECHIRKERNRIKEEIIGS